MHQQAPATPRTPSVSTASEKSPEALSPKRSTLELATEEPLRELVLEVCTIANAIQFANASRDERITDLATTQKIDFNDITATLLEDAYPRSHRCLDLLETLGDLIKGPAETVDKSSSIALMQDLFTRLYTVSYYLQPDSTGRATKQQAVEAMHGIYDVAHDVQDALGIGDAFLFAQGGKSEEARKHH